MVNKVNLSSASSISVISGFLPERHCAGYWSWVYNNSVTTLEKTRQLLIDQIPYLQKLGIIKTGIFGSVVRGEDTLESDIDN